MEGKAEPQMRVSNAMAVAKGAIRELIAQTEVLNAKAISMGLSQ